MDAESLREFFEPAGPVSIRKMFGALGVYADGLCIACLIRGELFMKGDARSEAEFLAAGCGQWTYQHAGSGKVVKMPYWRLTESAHDDPAELKRWSELALQAARRQQAEKAAIVTRKPKKSANPP